MSNLPPHASSTGRLDALVETSKVGQLATVVGKGSHVPVGAGLERGIVEPVEHVQEHGANVVTVGEVGTDLAGLPRVPSLEDVATAPNSHSHSNQNAKVELGAPLPGQTLQIQ